MLKGIRYHVRTWCFGAIALLASAGIDAYAERPDSLSDLRSRTLTEVGVSTKAAPRNISSTMPVQSLSRKEIEEQGMRDLADAVRRFAGVTVKDYGGMGGLKTVSVRNMGAAHTGVSYDGIALSNCQAGQIDIGRFALEDIENVSLSVGLPTDLLQSARLSASGAVLSLQSLQPQFREGCNYALSLMCRAGSFGEVNPVLRYSQRLGRRTTASAYINYLRADGAYPFELRNVLTVTQEKRHNSDIGQLHGEINVNHLFADSSRLDVKAYGLRSERGLPGTVILYVREAHERLWDENAFAQASYRKDFGRRYSLLAQGKYTYARNKYQDRSSQYAGGVMTERTIQQEGYLNAALRFRPDNHWTVSLAHDEGLNTFDCDPSEMPRVTRHTMYTALNTRYAYRTVIVDASLTHTFVSEDAESGKLPDNLSHLSPSLSVSVRPMDQFPLRLRAMYRNTYRVPSFNELYYPSLGFYALRPENAHQYSAGLTYSAPRTGWVQHIFATVDGYYNRVSDKIVAFPSAYVWRMRNYGTAALSGIDATLQGTLLPHRRFALDLSVNYTWQRAIDLTDKTAKNYRNQLPYTPEHSGHVGTTARTPWIDVSYTVFTVGERYIENQNIEQYRLDRYHEHALTASRSILWGKTKVNLTASVLNLTNEQYAVIKNYPMPGRSYKFTVRVQL